MAINEALREILNDWQAIEPLLTVNELEDLADADTGGLRYVSQPEAMLDRPDLGSVLFRILSPALPADHSAWEALALVSPGASQDAGWPAATPELDLIERAFEALEDPAKAADAATDELAERTKAAVLAAGAVQDGPDLEADELWLMMEFGGRAYYPAFQFSSTNPCRQHEIVAALRPQLAADHDPVGAAAWWLTPSPWLNGARPADLLGTERDAEIAYAADQLANDSW